MADTAALPAGPHGSLRRWLGAGVVTAVTWGGHTVKKARAWRLHAAVPGVAGAALVSAGFGLKLGLWAGFIAAGLFLLRLDNRL